jgi:thiamine phosphate synthase YjbQ (UPF0047 family)
MADIAVFLAPGQPIEKTLIVSGADTGQANITITFSTTAFTTKESVIRVLTEINNFLQGWTFPPSAHS